MIAFTQCKTYFHNTNHTFTGGLREPRTLSLKWAEKGLFGLLATIFHSRLPIKGAIFSNTLAAVGIKEENAMCCLPFHVQQSSCI